MRELVIEEMYRIAGEAKLILYEDEGYITNVYFLSRSPIRGFEKLVLGKNPLFAVEAVMRICGLCHTAHGIAISEAIENAIGIVPPRNGLLLREALGLINRIQSHILQLIMICGDFIKLERRKDLIYKLIKIYGRISDYILNLGGAATHPPYLTVGGILKPPKEKIYNFLKDGFPEIEKLWKDLKDELLNENNLTDIAKECMEKIVENKFMASHLFYGDKYNISLNDISTMPYWDYRKGSEELIKQSTSLVAFYQGNIVEVGPRARLNVYRYFQDNSIYGLYSARIEEVSLSLLRIKELFNEINLDEPFRTRNIVFGPGEGVGVYEAPRGTLIHHIKLGEEGRVMDMKIIVPTMFNIPSLEKAVKGLGIKACGAAIRLYDPCIPCTTH